MQTGGEATVWLSPRERLIGAAVGVVVASVAVPMILWSWAPRAFTIGWLVTYLAVSAGFMLRIGRRPAPIVEQWWSSAIAVLFSALLVASVVWSDDIRHFWAAVVLALAFLTFEIATLPFIDTAEWRITFLIVSLTIVATGLTRVHPVVALSFLPLAGTFVDGVSRVRSLKRSTERDLERVNAMVNHDDLTGLLNRRGMHLELQRAIGETSTVVMFDADRFKQINDTYGYAVGDQVLQQLGRELERRLPNAFVLGRQGGDEFVAIAHDEISLPEPLFAPVACSVLWLGQPLTLNVHISAGLTVGQPNASVDLLLREAGFALRESKRSTRRLVRFTGELRSRFERSLEIAALATADGDDTRRRDDALLPFGQVIVADDRIVGVEVLVRWRRADGTVLGPEDFLPMAVRNGTMPSINELMIEHAVRFAARFNHIDDAPFVSANVTATHLTSPGFGQWLSDLLAAHQVAPARLMIEITESEYVHRGRGWEDSAIELRTAGIKLAIDDFGSGYSSIERLHRLPITHIKFDRSMVRSVSSPFGEITKGLARFSEASQIAIVAEGVETTDELASMQALGVHLYQGYLFGAPDELDEIERRVRSELQRDGARTTTDP